MPFLLLANHPPANRSVATLVPPLYSFPPYFFLSSRTPLLNLLHAILQNKTSCATSSHFSSSTCLVPVFLSLILISSLYRSIIVEFPMNLFPIFHCISQFTIPQFAGRTIIESSSHPRLFQPIHSPHLSKLLSPCLLLLARLALFIQYFSTLPRTALCSSFPFGISHAFPRLLGALLSIYEVNLTPSFSRIIPADACPHWTMICCPDLECIHVERLWCHNPCHSRHEKLSIHSKPPSA